VREHTSPQVWVGFGIGTPAQAKEGVDMADGVIVDITYVRTIGGGQTPIETAKQFIAEFGSALNASND
jgi:tryptophan synthase alpha subunit